MIDAWVKVVKAFQGHAEIQYGREPEGGKTKSLLHTPLDVVEEPFEKFRARRSLRDVEPKANVWVRSLGWETEDDPP